MITNQIIIVYGRDQLIIQLASLYRAAKTSRMTRQIIVEWLRWKTAGHCQADDVDASETISS